MHSVLFFQQGMVGTKNTFLFIFILQASIWI